MDTIALTRAAANRAPEGRENQTFRQKLAKNPPTAGAQRNPHGDFSLPDSATCEQKVGNIHARDAQYEGDGAEQKP